MKRVLMRLGIILAWIVVLWGCLVVAFGSADFYSVRFGGAVPGDLVMGDPAPTLMQSSTEIAVGLGMIALGLLARWRLRRALNERFNRPG
jgi:MYXO-CTERM domain-containing protein